MTSTQDVSSTALALQNPVVIYQIGEDAITLTHTPSPPTTNKPPDYRHPDEVETQHEFTQEDMAELIRLWHDLESDL